MIKSNSFPSPTFSEPVSELSQLLGLSFLAPIVGFIESQKPISGFRLTFHRSVARAGKGYLQQVCRYAGAPQVDGGEGRFFKTDSGIIGQAFSSKRIWRTRHSADLKIFETQLLKAMKNAGDDRTLDKVGRSWLAIPFVADKAPALIFFAESNDWNFFSSDAIVKPIISMTYGICDLIENLEANPLGRTRNFQVPPAEPEFGGLQPYEGIHEVHPCVPPKFSSVYSFNFEASSF